MSPLLPWSQHHAGNTNPTTPTEAPTMSDQDTNPPADPAAAAAEPNTSRRDELAATVVIQEYEQLLRSAAASADEDAIAEVTSDYHTARLRRADTILSREQDEVMA